MVRSRRRANEVARAAVEKGNLVTDADVLDTLRLWRFPCNSTRRNVLPVGSSFVHSDNLGLVRSRDGRIVVTAVTRKHPYVLQVLARWLRDHRPAELQRDFEFSSISLNYGYAARLHSKIQKHDTTRAHNLI